MKIHLLGPSCSGQSTLGKLISQKYQIPYFDTDDIVWIETDPPFSIQRKNIEKMELLKEIF
jgi:adenylate kinase family enzyme